MKTNKKITVLIVDDSLFFRNMLKESISKDPFIEVVAVAKDAYEARDKIIEFRPDVMTLDVEMPRMNGIDFLKKLLPQYPIPVVVISGNGSNVFDALNAGAVDFVAKANFREKKDVEVFLSELNVKIKVASEAKVTRPNVEKSPVNLKDKSIKNTGIQLIAIGASTGGTEATHSVLKTLPKTVPGIVIAQHMPPMFTKMYANRLHNSCLVDVKEAEDGDLILPGRILIAPGDYHMEVVRRAKGLMVRCSNFEKVNGHRPSVDVLFHSVATAVGENSVGIILTGMGKDGAEGLLAMRKKGAFTIGQDQKSSVVYGMPKVAYTIGAVAKQTSLQLIPNTLCNAIQCQEK